MGVSPVLFYPYAGGTNIVNVVEAVNLEISGNSHSVFEECKLGTKLVQVSYRKKQETVSGSFTLQMVIVDTPGTNVILQRQQRLTEEFVPRADLLVFVLSADRPLSESEYTCMEA
ncbi:putative transmembrane GTPase FZO-like chloroplastic [Bienertia sinuspersici]